MVGGALIVTAMLGLIGIVRLTLKIRTPDDTNASIHSRVGKQGLPGGVTTERDAQADVLVKLGTGFCIEKQIARQGIDEQACINDGATHDAKHVLGVVGVALFPGLVGGRVNLTDTMVALV